MSKIKSPSNLLSKKSYRSITVPKVKDSSSQRSIYARKTHSGLTERHYPWWMVGNSNEFPTLRIAPLRKSYYSYSTFTERSKYKTDLFRNRQPIDASSIKSLSNFEEIINSENQEVEITLTRLQSLLDEDDEDDYGIAKPSFYAYGTALALVSEAARLMGDQFTRASVSTDDRGGIRLTWTRPKAEVRLVCAHQSDQITYLYHETEDEYHVENNVSDKTLAHWLNWLNTI